MEKLRFRLTVFIVKFIIKFMKLLGFNATDTPGAIALKLYPNIIKNIVPPKTVIAITGTNGKTSTNNILSQTLRNLGYDVIDNGFGSNIHSGITTCLLTHCDLKGVCHQDFACLEIDERSSIRIYKNLHPDYLICTNLQRDSTKRNANVEYIFDMINNYLPKSTKLILNGDDLISSQLGKGINQRVFFRVTLQENEICRDNIIKDIVVCPKCGSRLQWEFIRNHSIGQAHCPNCDFASEKCQYATEKVENGIVTFSNGAKTSQYPLVGYRTSDFYNETAVLALLSELHIDEKKIAKALEQVEVPKSRLIKETVNGIEIISILSKGMNPVAITNSCDVINKDKRRKAVILNIDDTHDSKYSSEMITYIYEVDFEFLKDANISQILIGGKRSIDYKLRLLYGGIESELIKTVYDQSHTADNLDMTGLEVVYILFDMYDIPTYKLLRNKVIEKAKEVK